MTELDQPRATNAASKSGARQSPHDDEVFGMLGALLGTLEVIATDDRHPLSTLQSERMRGALRLGNALQSSIEALLMLADDQLASRLSRTSVPVRPLIEHAVRGALRSFEQLGVVLVLPSGTDWGQQRVSIDASRVDRAVCALAEQLAQRVGQGGVLEVAVEQGTASVVIVMRGRAGVAGDKVRDGVVLHGARRLLELHGGTLDVDATGLLWTVALPHGEAP